jgi:uncharacterized protein
MEEPMNSSPYSSSPTFQNTFDQEDIQRRFIVRVYGWMTLGLIVTAAAAFFTLAIPGLLPVLLSNQLVFLGLFLVEILMVGLLSGLVNRLSPVVAGMLFISYAILNGVTLSIVMLIYTASSVATVFGITACTFGIMTLWGYTTHRDLTRMGNLLIMALFGMVIASLVNLFLVNSAIYWITTYVGVLIFIGLIAYDTQKLKAMSTAVSSDGQMAQKASIVGALRLYLDFINLFLLLLRILGGRRK